jgi:hypothetical protein
MPFISPNSTMQNDVTLNAAHNGKTLVFDSSDDQTLTVSRGLPRGFTARIVRTGTGELDISSASGVTLQNAPALARYESAEIIQTGANNFVASSRSASLHLIDPDYVPFEGSLDADNLFSVGSNDNVQNNAGVIETSNHFVGFANDLKIVASGDDEYLVGMLNQFRVSGDLTGDAPLYGHWTFVCNRGLVDATPQVIGGNFEINLEGDATEAVGLQGIAYRGSNVANPVFTGVRGIAANGYADATQVQGGDFLVRTVSSAANIVTARSIWAHADLTAGHSVTNLRLIDISGIESDAAITNSAAIYIDTSVDVGSTAYAIQSLSLSPSLFSGAIQIKEQAEPFSAPANSLYLYAIDNGSGKTKLMVKFPSGSAVQLAIEP